MGFDGQQMDLAGYPESERVPISCCCIRVGVQRNTFPELSCALLYRIHPTKRPRSLENIACDGLAPFHNSLVQVIIVLYRCLFRSELLHLAMRPVEAGPVFWLGAPERLQQRLLPDRFRGGCSHQGSSALCLGDVVRVNSLHRVHIVGAHLLERLELAYSPRVV